MKYMLLIYGDEHVWRGLDEPERQRVMEEFGRFTREVKSTGRFAGGAQLQSASLAANVQVRDGRRLVTDGPFAETREQLGGFYVIDAADLDEALAIAERIPSARFGCIEVRPLVEAPVPATT